MTIPRNVRDFLVSAKCLSEKHVFLISKFNRIFTKNSRRKLCCKQSNKVRSQTKEIPNSCSNKQLTHYFYLQQTRTNPTARENQIKTLFENPPDILSHMLCSYFSAFYGHRVNKKNFFSQMISAADVEQHLLFVAIFLQTSIQRETVCMLKTESEKMFLDFHLFIAALIVYY
jgi:hypothetical protein